MTTGYRSTFFTLTTGSGQFALYWACLYCVKVLVKVSLVVVINHSCLDRRYPIGFALFPCLRAPGFMLMGGARGKKSG